MNLRWVPAPELVREADQAAWDAPGARTMRRVNYAAQVRTSFGGALMFALGSIASFLGATQVHHGKTVLAIAGGLAALVTVVLIWLLLFMSPRQLMRAAPLTSLCVLPSAGVLITIALIAIKNEFPQIAILYVEAPLLGFYLFRRWYATALVALTAAEYAIVLAQQDVTFARAAALWFIVISTVAAAGVLIGGWGARADQLSTSEHAARTALAELNETLEERVNTQVEELERLGNMRRFLSPQIADAVVSGGDGLLEPHRRRIAVMFCDLRGFTAFTNRAEPEEVMQILDEYYQAVGEVLRAHDATIGGFAGDGVMAYFGDPVPRTSAALDAMAAAMQIATVLDARCAEWERREHRIGYGIGLAFGYATLGVVGFDGRYDYTPLGAVVNLAARLCANAANGQVLVDHAMQCELDGTFDTVELAGFDLKGFGSDTRVHAVSVKKARPSTVRRLSSLPQESTS